MEAWTPVIIAIITAGGSLAGWAALRKAGREADKANAEAAAAIVGAADDVVALLRKELAEVRKELAEVRAERTADRERLDFLEVTWDGWAERVLALMDRSFGLLAAEHQETLRDDFDEIRRTRPVRHH